MKRERWRHSPIPTCVDLGFEQAGSAHLLVMELVEGETLADWIARGPIAIERDLQLLLQIAAGLEAAHTKGIVHRDLKPANLEIAGSATSSPSPRAVCSIAPTRRRYWLRCSRTSRT